MRKTESKSSVEPQARASQGVSVQADTPPTRRIQQLATRPWFICGLLALVTFAVFSPAVRHDFINYDDPMCVTENVHLQQGSIWEIVKWAFSTGYYGNWMPVTWLSHLLDLRLFGLKPGGHHLMSLLLHVANTVLLFLVMRRLTGAHWRSGFVAALFALHPLHVEPVAWAALRRDVLSMLFFLLTLWAYARYAEAQRGKGADGPGRKGEAPTGHVATRFPFSPFYLAALTCFTLGLMSKQMLVTLPFVLLLLDYWPLKRIALGPRFSGLDLRLVWKLVREKIPFFALAMLTSVVAFQTQHQAGALPSVDKFPLWDRFANALTSYVAYLRKLVWPDDLSVFYPYPLTFSAGKVALAGAFLLVVTGLVVLGLRRRPWLAVGWFWYVGMLVPVIGFVQVGAHSMADRYTYIPLIGIFIVLAWALAELASRRPAGRMVAVLVGVSVLGACVVATTRQLSYWRNTFTLFEHALALNFENSVAHDNLGAEYCAQRKYDLARPHFEAALQLTPQNYVSQCHMGFIRLMDGKLDESIDHFAEALRIKPELAEAESGLGAALARKGRVDEAIEHLREAIRLDAQDAAARANMGNILLHRGQVNEAKEYFAAALRIKPDDAGANSGLATCLARLGKLAEAVQHFDAALRAAPDSAQSHKLLAKALVQQDRLPEAVTHYSTAFKLDPRDVETLNQLGTTLARLGKLDAAITNFHLALAVGTNQAVTHENLGLALLLQAKTSEAVAQFQEAIRRQPDSPEALNNLAWILATQRDARYRDGTQAVLHAARAVALTRTNDVGKLDTLAAAYAEAGRFADAVATARRAAELATAAGQTGLTAQIRTRLEFYERAQPYREP